MDNDSREEAYKNEQQQEHPQQRGEDRSGEGAASALAHLKNRLKQHRRHSGAAESAPGGPE